MINKVGAPFSGIFVSKVWLNISVNKPRWLFKQEKTSLFCRTSQKKKKAAKDTYLWCLNKIHSKKVISLGS